MNMYIYQNKCVYQHSRYLFCLKNEQLGFPELFRATSISELNLERMSQRVTHFLSSLILRTEEMWGLRVT